jgi:ATP-binding cassette, subfamily B, bacterial CvaB/MchF/RaxB
MMPFHHRDVRQSEVSECGLACLAIASGLLGAHLDMVRLRQAHPVPMRGLNLKEIQEIASQLGMAAAR